MDINIISFLLKAKYGSSSRFKRYNGFCLSSCTGTFIMVIVLAIPLIETSEVDMHEMVLSWFLRNLHAQGILHAINGIIVGKPAVEEKPEKYKAVYKQIVGFEANLQDHPILYNVNVGHAYPIGVFPLGLPYEIDCDNKTLTLLESATE